MRSYAAFTLLFSACLQMGCASLKPAPGPDPKWHGFWRSEGYGYFIEIEKNAVQVFDVTDEVCVSNPKATTYLKSILADVSSTLDTDNTRFRVALVSDEQGIALQRVSSRPATCLDLIKNTPINNFKAFTSIFSTHYGFFDLYDVHWRETVEAAQPRINNTMTATELFTVFTDMLAPLRDGHVSLNARIKRRDREFEPYDGQTLTRLQALAMEEGILVERFLDQALDRYWRKGIRKNLLSSKGKMAGDGLIQYGLLDDKVGYLALLAMEGYADSENNIRLDIESLNKALDKAIALFTKSGTEALIIDLSINFGGYDAIGRQLASRFAKEKTFVYDKRPLDNPRAEPFPLYVEPSEKTRFEGPIYLLTTDMTVSAGETTTLALRALPHVVHAGEATQGALSDVLLKALPNGWTITLSNEEYRDSRGVKWEGRGIEPGLKMSVFDSTDPRRGHVEAVRKLQHLARDQLKD